MFYRRSEDLKKQLGKFSQLALPPLPPREQKKNKEKKSAPKKKMSEAEQLFSLEKDDLADLEDDESQEGMLKEEPLTDEEVHYQRTSIFLLQLNHGFLRELLEFGSTYFDLFVKNAEECHQNDLQKLFEGHTTKLFSQYVQLVNNHLLTQHNISFVLQCLELLGESFQQIVSENELEGEMGVGSRLSNILGDIISAFMVHQQQECLQNMRVKISVLQRFVPSASLFVPALAASSAGSHCDRIAVEMKGDIDQLIKNASIILAVGDSKCFLAQHALRVWRTLAQSIISLGPFMSTEAASYIERQAGERKGKRPEDSTHSSAPPIFLGSKISRSFIGLN